VIGRLRLVTETRPGRERETVVAANLPSRPSTKAELPAPIGPEGVVTVLGATRVRVIAIGGVRPDRVSLCLAAGAHGVAVVEAVSGALDPRTAVHQLRAVLG